MNLSTRLTIAMVSLVLLTAVAVGYLSYRNLEASALPTELTRLESRARLHVASLDNYVSSARADVLMMTGAPALDGMRRARAAGGIDPLRNMSEHDWRGMLALLMTAEVKTKPAYDQFRLIGISDGGRELIRVDHSGPNGAVRIVPDAELQQKSDRPYFQDAIRLAAGQVYISHIELNQEHGVIQNPHVPAMRAATPVFDLNGKIFGVLVINVDMRPEFAQLRQTARIGGNVYVVDASGNYLLNPNLAREFGFDLGHPYKIQSDFPALATALASGATIGSQTPNAAGQDSIVSMVSAHIAGGPQVSVIEALPLDVALASAGTIGRSSLIGAIIAALCAGLLAAFTARSLTRPLKSLAQSLEHFTGEEVVSVPVSAAGEIGVLARALKRMADAVREKTTALQKEIEERNRAEIKVGEYAEREKLYLAAVESANDAIFTIDLGGTITTWNPAAERLFGFPAAEAIGKKFSVIATPDQQEQQNNNFERIKRGERLENFETTRTRKDGSTIHLSYNSSPILSTTGEIAGASAIARDISERKHHEKILAERALELQRSNAELEQFAYVASHDLQEPLRMVASYAELLAERYRGKLDDKADKYIAYAVDGAKRMQRLVNDLLSYSRLGTQGHPLQPTDANIVAGHVLRALKHKIDEAGAQVEVDSLPVVSADDGQLGQLFQNLIGNALKFHSDKRPLRVRVGARPSPQGWLFSVEDNGIGIDPQYAERVFQMFQRLHNREAYEGSGIGLTIAKKIVERHGGRIWFESEPGKGTTFFFTLSATQEKAA